MLEALRGCLDLLEADESNDEWAREFAKPKADAARAAIRAAEGRTDLGAAKHVHSFSIWHDRQDRPAHGYSRCACGVEPGDAWAEAK